MITQDTNTYSATFVIHDDEIDALLTAQPQRIKHHKINGIKNEKNQANFQNQHDILAENLS